MKISAGFRKLLFVALLLIIAMETLLIPLAAREAYKRVSERANPRSPIPPPVTQYIETATLKEELRLWNNLRGFYDFIATTYDLSYASCGKLPSHPQYGITFSGTRAVPKRTIAVDPDVIPLGSRVYIVFPDEYRKMSGWYTAEDTGSRVKGRIVDVFLGESAFFEMERFGSRKVKIKIAPQIN